MLPAVASIWRRFKGSLAAFAAIWRNPNLRWLELAWTASIVGQYAFLVAVSVYAYGIGGEKAVGLIFLARLIPAALLAPFAGMLGDRYPRERVLLVTNIVRVVLVGAAALAVFADADPWVVYGFAIAATIATTPFRSSQAALTPSLARTPEELTAANAVASGVESVAVFAGPALAGVLFAVASTGSCSRSPQCWSSSRRSSSSSFTSTAPRRLVASSKPRPSWPSDSRASRRSAATVPCG